MADILGVPKRRHRCGREVGLLGAKYDLYQNKVRKGEALAMLAGAPFPSGADASEWKKHSTVEAHEIDQNDRQTIADKECLPENDYNLYRRNSTDLVRPPFLIGREAAQELRTGETVF